MYCTGLFLLTHVSPRPLLLTPRCGDTLRGMLRPTAGLSALAMAVEAAEGTLRWISRHSCSHRYSTIVFSPNMMRAGMCTTCGIAPTLTDMGVDRPHTHPNDKSAVRCCPQPLTLGDYVVFGHAGCTRKKSGRLFPVWMHESYCVMFQREAKKFFNHNYMVGPTVWNHVVEPTQLSGMRARFLPRR